LPLYSSYVVIEKWRDGREISSLEWVVAVAEPASFLLPGGKAATTTLGHAGKRLTTNQLSRALRSSATSYAGKTLSRRMAAQMSAHLAKKGAARQAAHWGTSQLLTQMQHQVKGLLRKVDRLASLDITRPVQFVFKRSGLERKTFKRLTGLEAQLFMRGDARVHVHLLRRETVEKGLDALGKGQTALGLVQTFFEKTSRPRATPTHHVGPSAAPALRTTSPPATPVLHDGGWGKNVSAWWLGHACNVWKHLGPEPPRTKP
jgi:hypothetical protein